MAAIPRRRTPQTAGANALLPPIRSALSALVREQRSSVLMAGANNDRSSEAAQRFRQQYTEGIRAAMQSGLLTLDVMPDAIWCVDHPVLDATERKGDFVEALYAEGIRNITIEPEATDRELNILADILLINWADRRQDEADLRAIVQESDLTRVRLEILDRLQDKDATGDSPAIARIEAMIDALESEASASDESGTLRQDEVEVMLRIRGGMGEAHEGAALKQEEGERSPRLEEEMRRIAAGRDLDDMPELLSRCVECAPTTATAELLGRSMVDWIVRGLEASAASGSDAVWALLELLDPACTPAMRWRDPLRASLAEIVSDDQLSEIRRLLPPAETPQLRGRFFSIGSAIQDPEVLHRLSSGLPSWTIRAIADAVVLREQAAPAEGDAGSFSGDLFDRIRPRVLSEDYGAIRLGLAMAARVEDARFGELLLSLTSHASGQIREEALYALRRHPTARLRARVQELFTDPEEVVRLEVLRHAVAMKDQQIARRVEARLLDPAIAQIGEAEIRALCIAMGRVLKGEAEPVLLAFALGQKVSPSPLTPKMALHGLKASGGRGARNALQRVITEAPRFATEAESILREMGA